MAHRIIKQPNGKYAAFSDPVDHFVAYDATREAIIEFCMKDWDMGKESAERKVKRADKDLTMDGGTGRFEEALDQILTVHGKDEAEKTRRLLTT